VKVAGRALAGKLNIRLPLPPPFNATPGRTQDIKAKPEPVATTLSEHESYLVDFINNYSNYIFDLTNCMFSCYANMTLPYLWNFGYSWDYQTIVLFFLVPLHVFHVFCKIKSW